MIDDATITQLSEKLHQKMFQAQSREKECQEILTLLKIRDNLKSCLLNTPILRPVIGDLRINADNAKATAVDTDDIETVVEIPVKAIPALRTILAELAVDWAKAMVEAIGEPASKKEHGSGSLNWEGEEGGQE